VDDEEVYFLFLLVLDEMQRKSAVSQIVPQGNSAPEFSGTNEKWSDHYSIKNFAWN